MQGGLNTSLVRTYNVLAPIGFAEYLWGLCQPVRNRCECKTGSFKSMHHNIRFSKTVNT